MAKYTPFATSTSTQDRATSTRNRAATATATSGSSRADAANCATATIAGVGTPTTIGSTDAPPTVAAGSAQTANTVTYPTAPCQQKHNRARHGGHGRYEL